MPSLFAVVLRFEANLQKTEKTTRSGACAIIAHCGRSSIRALEREYGVGDRPPTHARNVPELDRAQSVISTQANAKDQQCEG